MPVDKDVFDHYIKTMERLAPEAQRCAAGIGRHQITVNEWAIAAGGHTRCGLEDNIRLDRDTRALSNAALVSRAVDLCAKYGRWRGGQQARETLQVPLR